MPFSDFHGNPETIHRLRDMLARERFRMPSYWPEGTERGSTRWL